MRSPTDTCRILHKVRRLDRSDGRRRYFLLVRGPEPRGRCASLPARRASVRACRRISRLCLPLTDGSQHIAVTTYDAPRIERADIAGALEETISKRATLRPSIALLPE